MKKLACLLCGVFLWGCGETGSSSFPITDTPQQTTTTTTSHEDSVLDAFDLAKYLMAQDDLVSYYETDDAALFCTLEGDSYHVQILDLHNGMEIASMETMRQPNCQPAGFWLYQEGSGFLCLGDGNFGFMEAEGMLVYGYDGVLRETVSLATLGNAGCVAYDIAAETLYYGMCGEEICVMRQPKNGMPERVFTQSPDGNLTGKLLAMYEMYVCGDAVYVAGTQSQNDAGSRTMPFVGILDVDTKTMQIRVKDNPQYSLQPYDAGVFYCDDGATSLSRYSGEVGYFSADETRTIALSYPQESFGAVASGSGMHFCTVLEGTGEDGAEVLRMQVYDDAGGCRATKQVTYPATEHRSVEQIFLSEKAHTAFFLLIRSGGATEWVTLDF